MTLFPPLHIYIKPRFEPDVTPLCSPLEASGSPAVYYDHPDWSNYDHALRPRQIQHREEELWEARTLFCSSSEEETATATTSTTTTVDPSLERLRALVDPESVFVGGYSYGAATASLAAVKRHGSYKGAVLFDGWFHINMPSV